MRTWTIFSILLATILTTASVHAGELARLQAVADFQVSPDVDINGSPCNGFCFDRLIRVYNEAYGTSLTPMAVTRQIAKNPICLRSEGPGATQHGYRFDQITYPHHSMNCIARAISQMRAAAK